MKTDARAIPSVDVSNVLNEEKKQQVIALGRLGWSLRRIEKSTGVRRETAAAYLKAAGVDVRPPGAWGRQPPRKPANGVITGSTASKPANEIAADPGPAKPANEVITDSGAALTPPRTRRPDIDPSSLQVGSRGLAAHAGALLDASQRPAESA